jgi:hypothetical protein
MTIDPDDYALEPVEPLIQTTKISTATGSSCR